MGVSSGSNRRQGASAGGADQISDLCDDVLVRILELLPDAEDAVRTGALSRRWRGLWTRVSSLRFSFSRSISSSSRQSEEKIQMDYSLFLAFVSNALARRAMTTDDAAALEHLSISFAAMYEPAGEHANGLALRSATAAQEWVRLAVQGGTVLKSFVLQLQLSPWEFYCRHWLEIDRDNRRAGQQQAPMMDLSELVGSSKLETMHWKMQGVRLKLPAAAVFASLVDLSLEDIEVAAGSGHLLARLLSSVCCPSLQKLQLRKLKLPDPNELLIEATALLVLELSMTPFVSAQGPRILKLKTPSLRFLRIYHTYGNLDRIGISALRLEELVLLSAQPKHIDVDGELPCVRSIKLELNSHGGEDDIDINNDVSISLLRCCTSSLTCLEVSLHITEEYHWAGDIISGRIPCLPHLVSLTVHAYMWELHSVGVGVAEILKQCGYLKYLRVHCSIMQPGCHDNDYLCDHHHPDHWKAQQQIMCLPNLQEVEFTGLAGTDCDRWFIEQLLANATRIQKLALNFNAARFRQNNMMIDGSGFISCISGTWTRTNHHGDDPCVFYEWSPNPTHE